MHKVYVDDLRPGMSLGKEIRNDYGHTLLAKGVTLTPRYIRALKDLGFYAVYIRDGVADDVMPQDVISDEVHSAVSKHVRQLFSIAQNAPSVGKDSKQQLPGPRLVAAAGPSIGQLYRDIEAIIDQATNAQVLSGIISLKSHDNYTFLHSVEVAVAAVLLGLRMHLKPFELHQLALGCLCHDIGKLAIPQEILQKPGPLTDAEWALVREHPSKGFEIIQQTTGSNDIIARHVVWQHHERQDGLGYPRGLRGTNMASNPDQARFGRGLMLPAAEIAAIAEVYASLGSDQPYRPAVPPIRISALLREMAGSQLNREVVRRFLTILPVFPVGTEVVVIAGRLRGHRGIVTEINREDLQRPKVRIVLDPQGREIPPVELDSSEERDVQLAVASYLEATGDQPDPHTPPPSSPETGEGSPVDVEQSQW